MLTPLSRFAFINEAWLVLEWIFESSEFAFVCSAVEVGFFNGTCLVLEWISKSSAIAGVGSAVEVGLACILGNCEKLRFFACVGSAMKAGFDFRGLFCIAWDFSKF